MVLTVTATLIGISVFCCCKRRKAKAFYDFDAINKLPQKENPFNCSNNILVYALTIKEDPRHPKYTKLSH